MNIDDHCVDTTVDLEFDGFDPSCEAPDLNPPDDWPDQIVNLEPDLNPPDDWPDQIVNLEPDLNPPREFYKGICTSFTE